MKPLPPAHKKMQLVMGNLLRAGVITSAVLVLLGGVLYLQQTDKASLHYAVFTGEEARLTDLSALLKGVIQLNGASIIQIGLLLLIATPVARILLAFAGFLLEKDYLYVAITLLVLLVICISIFSGKAG